MNNSLIPIKEKNIFEKIKNFFQRVFIKQPEYAIENNCNISNTNIETETLETQKSDFIDNIKIEKTEEQKLLKIQKLIREKRISENDLSIEEKNKLRKLYNSQIEDLKEAILQKTNNIMRIKYEQKRKAHANI